MDVHRLAHGHVLIVGAGLAGLFLALKLAPRPCVIVSPTAIGHGASSAWAQGGLAAALAPQDSPQSHADDTIAAGDGLVDPVMALLLAQEGPARVRDLLALGVAFDRHSDGSFALSREAAHSHARVARVTGDKAGHEIMAHLIAAVQRADHITVHEGLSARALLQDGQGRICGIWAIDAATGGDVQMVADETVLATGGIGGLYAVTTNPIEAAGHGLAMAAQCGALIGDPEFVQFHPTALNLGIDPAPLATEALRGEGAQLVNRDGAAFMHRYDPAGDLAARDIVARAVAIEAASYGGAYLDCTTAIGTQFQSRFPTVYASCHAAHLDPATDLLPVCPAAHYHMGGIVTDIWGKTSLAGLSALGECASTGVHGANRLASNSLLEAVVFAHRVAERLRGSPFDASPSTQSDLTHARPRPLAPSARAALRTAMTAHAGVVRDAQGLQKLRAFLTPESGSTDDGGSLEHTAARLIVDAALARTESRGGHFRADFPHAHSHATRSFITTNLMELN
ncbi:MAG: hypothetical protein RLZZ157_532 [Pseudomonadota bacterium]|jgi:L-aspartate oxidase